MKEDLSKDNVRGFLSIRLKNMINKLDVLIATNQCDDDVTYKEFTKLKNELLSDLKILYNDENIKLEFEYEISKNVTTIVCKALNNFSYYLLNGYDYDKLKEMNITGDDIITNPGEFYGNFLKNNYRKHEL